MKTHDHDWRRIVAGIAGRIARSIVALAPTLVRVPALATLVMAASAVTAAPAILSTTLEPTKITIGHTALLTITTQGGNPDAVILPFVGGLEFRTVSQSHRVDAASAATRTTIVVRVTPQMAGTFSIPALAPNLDALTLTVDPDRLVVDTAPVPHKSAAPPKVVPRALVTEGIQLKADGAAFVRLDVPKRQAYVGESIPIEIEVGVRAGAVTSLNGLPTLTGGDFTLDNLSRQPERGVRSIDGLPFTVFLWHSVIAPVKQGSFPFSVEIPLTVKFSTRPKAEARFDAQMGDPFLQNFYGATVTKDLKVSSPPSELNVLALPTQNRPADFSGAVGTFGVSSELAAGEAAAGDPLSLRLHVIGSGNFDRVDTAMLGTIPGWKTYPPRSTFTGSDTLGTKGEKIFEQTLVASGPGVQTLPSLAFSFFDPVAGRYQTLHTAPLTVTIGRSPAESSSTVATAALPGPALPAGGSFAGLRPDHRVTARRADSLWPPYLRVPFLATYGVLTLGLAGGYLGFRRRLPSLGDRDLPGGRAAIRAHARLIAQLEASAAAGDRERFFALARSALQTSLARRWGLAPERVTALQIDARLGAAGQELRKLFELADEVRYLGTQLSAADYTRWTQIVRRQLSGEPAA